MESVDCVGGSDEKWGSPRRVPEISNVARDLAASPTLRITSLDGKVGHKPRINLLGGRRSRGFI